MITKRELKRCLVVFTTLLSTLIIILPASAQKTVVATISQIGEPLSVITKGRVVLQTLMGEGVDPHLYRLTRSDVAKLVRADLIIYNGLQLEAQMLGMMRRLGKRKPVVAVGDSLIKRELLLLNGQYPDPHIWMSPRLWAKALDTAVRALTVLDPPNAAFYRTNAGAYFNQLDKLDQRARSAIESIPASNRVMITAHDAFGYFGRAYGLEVMAVQGISTESQAGIKKIERLIDTLVDRNIGAVFFETTVSKRNVLALKEGAAARNHSVGIGDAIFSDAMGTKGHYTGTYIGMFDHNVTSIVRALGGVTHERGLYEQFAQKRH